jgi:hypothetical protein
VVDRQASVIVDPIRPGHDRRAEALLWVGRVTPLIVDPADAYAELVTRSAILEAAPIEQLDAIDLRLFESNAIRQRSEVAVLDDDPGVVDSLRCGRFSGHHHRRDECDEQGNRNTATCQQIHRSTSSASKDQRSYRDGGSSRLADLWPAHGCGSAPDFNRLRRLRPDHPGFRTPPRSLFPRGT